MDTDTAERIRGWSSQPVSGGHDALRSLADEEFSGAVSVQGTWMFLLNGRIVGMVDGNLDDVANADGTAYQAPDPALPLLFAMQEASQTETRSRYYTEDTPLEEVHETLSDGGFTGYIELAEDVLSGDYFVAYYGGRSLPAAFVGNRSETLTGQEAFERAADEVGIYEVVRASIEVTDVPEAPEESASAADQSSPTQSDSTDGEATSNTDEASPTSDDEVTSTEEGRSSESEAESAEHVDSAPNQGEPPHQDADPDPDSQTERRVSDPESDTAARGQSTQTETSTSPSNGNDGYVTRDQAGGGPSDDERAWQETRVVPSLDPNGSTNGQNKDTKEAAESPSGSPAQASGVGVTEGSSRESRTQPGPGSNEVSRLEAALDEAREQLARVENERDELKADRDDLAQRVDTLQAERDDLVDRVEELETELAEARATITTSSEADTDISPDHALSGTNVFVRYETKGQPTLEDIPNGASREQVDGNLRLDVVTQFDSNEATVEGEPFEQYLRETSAWRFVTWVVRELPYEIRDTSRENAMADLYSALPDIDRAEFDGTVEAETEDGQVRAEYDIVLRGRKGEPLIVADIDDSRDPVTGQAMESLIDRTDRVALGAETISAAISVTASFFQPDALETAEAATGGGILSRNSKASFVKTSRKVGYHLCLVEVRDDSFYVTVPEL